MTADDDPAAPEDETVTAFLAAETPQASPALRRRVRDGVKAAFGRRELRHRSAALLAAGAGLLTVAAVVALTMPS